jgi:hypothetical protein
MNANASKRCSKNRGVEDDDGEEETAPPSSKRVKTLATNSTSLMSGYFSSKMNEEEKEEDEFLLAMDMSGVQAKKKVPSSFRAQEEHKERAGRYPEFLFTIKSVNRECRFATAATASSLELVLGRVENAGQLALCLLQDSWFVFIFEFTLFFCNEQNQASFSLSIFAIFFVVCWL